MQYSVNCHLCSHLMSDHDIEQGNDHETISCKIEECTCRGIHQQFHTDISVLGLKKTYKTNEPINFSLKIQGYSKGGFMTLSIKNDKGTEIWSKKSFSNNPPDFPPGPFDLIFKFPAAGEIIRIENLGIYVLIISVNQHVIQEKFAVMK
ncbi:MAG TPA: hypothetical protein VLD38_07925 [Nitrosopumilaceae archaeon]|nr:hypothetical protein [Nitrosopumilaceae archaeon]